MVKSNIYSYAPKLLFFMALSAFSTALWLIYINKMILIELELINLGSSILTLPMILDIKGCLFSSVVLFISANVLNFSKSYMKDDKFINRFTILMLLFVLSMNLLIYLPNLIVLLLGWDGLGIVSFILVIYYQNSKSLAAGMITAMTNRIGDVMILLSIALTLNQGHWDIMNMWFNNSISNMQIIMIMCAAMTKSAQMPFSSWLPAAMAAPTPVSALVHSSTLVTAGVFLLVRFYPFLHKLNLFNTILLYLAMMTMIMSGLCACVEWDMKKIIALSTLSQLGLMMCSLGLNLPWLTYFHMVVHAMFKALLFICAGILISNYMHSQDLRWMGNLIKYMPMTASCVLVANLAMSGFPFLAAFYSKDAIIELSMFSTHSSVIMVLLYMSVGITSFYGVRFMYSILCNNYMGPHLYSPTEPKVVTNPMLLLALPSIMSGTLLWWLMPSIDKHVIMEPSMMTAPVVITLVGVFLAYIWNAYNADVEYPTLNMNANMWYLTPVSTQIPMFNYFSISKFYLEDIDHSWLEICGGMGLHRAITKSSNMPYMTMKYSPTSILLTSSILTLTFVMCMI
uniref:NADH dehydrogenase subunit 5 n=1 Tax=Barbronia yunnanensis TaxID=3027017 RepID=UPI0023D812E3|nr:NADH dehydrogenase subunit 5 [Barbronia yunnanensis]WDA96190.1 NADH dehydrogenase subunit 5 [Barbronia yunnanensis]